MMNFLFTCLDRFGEDASILFNDVDFRKQNVGFINRLINGYSDKFNFNMANSTLAKTATDLANELTKQSEKYSMIFNEMKERYDQQVEELTQMKNETEKKLKEEEEKNKMQIKKYKDEIESIKNDMESRIKSIEAKFERMCNQYESFKT